MRARPAGRTAAARRRSTVPWRGSDSAHTRPPLASTKPLDDREAEPRPAAVGRRRPRARTARTRAAQLGCGDARARGRSRASSAAPPVTRARTLTGWPPRVALRVLDQVREHALELGGVGLHQRQVAVERRPRRAPRAVGVLERAVDDLLDRAPVAPRLGLARLQAREVEQLVDQPPRAARPPRPRPPRARRARPRSIAGERSASPAARIAVSGVRRSCDTARSSAVLMTSRAPQRVRSRRPRPAAGRAPAPRPAAPPAPARPARAVAASAAASRSRRDAAAPRSRPSPTSSGRAAAGPCSAASSTMRGISQPERGRQPCDGDRQRRARRSASPSSTPRELGGEVGLLAAALGLGGPRARERRRRSRPPRPPRGTRRARRGSPGRRS